MVLLGKLLLLLQMNQQLLLPCHPLLLPLLKL
jgi:hypothetical protein